MVTIAEVVTRAFRKINVASEGEQLVADQVGAGVDAFNDMVFAWALEGVDIEHEELDASDEFPIGREFVEGTVYLLAERLAPDYNRPRNFDADGFFRKMQSSLVEIPQLQADPILLSMPSNKRFLD